jgi:putative membrane protein
VNGVATESPLDVTHRTEPARPRFEVHATADSHFAWLRTRLGVERTLLSWVRTAVALIGFGFTIVQFFERLGGMEGVEAAQRPQAPRYLGLAMIGAGVIALVISLWQYHSVLAYLRGGNFTPLAGLQEGPMQTPGYAVALALIFVGLFAFFAVLFRAV